MYAIGWGHTIQRALQHVLAFLSHLVSCSCGGMEEFGLQSLGPAREFGGAGDVNDDNDVNIAA